MRQREEHDVVAGEHLGARLLHDAVGERREVRLMLAEEIADAGVPGQRPDAHVGMGKEEPQELAPRVAGAACHCD